MKKIGIILTIIIALLIPVCVNAEANFQIKYLKETHYCACKECCGPDAKGITAYGINVNANNSYGIVSTSQNRSNMVGPFGTIIYTPGCNKYAIIADTGSDPELANGTKIDLFIANHNECFNAGDHGKVKLPVKVYNVVIPKSEIYAYSCSQDKMKAAVAGSAAVSDTPSSAPVTQPEEKRVWSDFGIIINGVEYYSDANITVEVDTLPEEITLVDRTNHPNNNNIKRDWRVWNLEIDDMDTITGGETQTISLNGKVDEYNIVTVGLMAEGDPTGKSSIIRFIVKGQPNPQPQLVWSDFGININGIEYYSENSFTVDVDVIPSYVTLIDKTNYPQNVDGSLRKWRVWIPAANDMETIAGGETQMIMLDGRIDENNIVTVGLMAEGDPMGKPSIIRFNVKGKPTTDNPEESQGPVQNTGEDFGIVVKSIDTDGTSKVKEYVGDKETIVITDSISNTSEVLKGIQLVNKSEGDRTITQWRVWNAKKGVLEVKENIDNPLELLKDYVSITDKGYKIRFGMTLSDGKTLGKDVYFKYAEFKVGVESGQIGGDTEDNPILEGEIPSILRVINTSGVNVEKYEIWNQFTERFEAIGGTANDQLIEVPTGAYGYYALDKEYSVNGKASVGIKMTLEDGTVSVKEIFFRKLMLNSPLQSEIVNGSKGFTISWNKMGEDVKYEVRMVNLTDKDTKGNPTEIYAGKVVTGTSFEVPSNVLKDDMNYRIAVRPEGARFWSIRTVTTCNVEKPVIENIKNGQIVVAGKDLKIELKDALNKNEKYYLSLIDTKQKERLVTSTNKDITILGDSLKEKGTYSIAVVKVLTVEDGATVVSSREEVNITVN